MIQHAGDLIQTSKRGQFIVTPLDRRAGDDLFEKLGGALQAAAFAAERDSAQMDADGLPGFPTKRGRQVQASPAAHGFEERYVVAFERIVLAVYVFQERIGAIAAEDVLAKVSGDALSAFVPQNEFAIAIHGTHGYRK